MGDRLDLNPDQSIKLKILNLSKQEQAMVTNAIRWTVKDLEAMPDDWGWKRYEVIDGELFVSRAPHYFHQRPASKLNILLGIWSEKTGLGEVTQTPGLVFSPEDGVIPDLVWASHERIAASLDEAGHFTLAPELVVEIVSAGKNNEQRDRHLKLRLYSKYGVREYWIVDWRQQTLEIYRRDQAQLKRVATLLDADLITSPLLPEFSVPLEQIFR